MLNDQIVFSIYPESLQQSEMLIYEIIYGELHHNSLFSSKL